MRIGNTVLDVVLKCWKLSLQAAQERVEAESEGDMGSLAAHSMLPPQRPANPQSDGSLTSLGGHILEPPQGRRLPLVYNDTSTSDACHASTVTACRHGQVMAPADPSASVAVFHSEQRSNMHPGSGASARGAHGGGTLQNAGSAEHETDEIGVANSKRGEGDASHLLGDCRGAQPNSSNVLPFPQRSSQIGAAANLEWQPHLGAVGAPETTSDGSLDSVQHFDVSQAQAKRRHSGQGGIAIPGAFPEQNFSTQQCEGERRALRAELSGVRQMIGSLRRLRCSVQAFHSPSVRPSFFTRTTRWPSNRLCPINKNPKTLTAPGY
jgi:hypothetical protein